MTFHQLGIIPIAGDDAASFTKEEMQQGKHTDYERILLEDMVANMTGEPTEHGDDTKKKNSRSPSPRDAWPNLSVKTTDKSKR